MQMEKSGRLAGALQPVCCALFKLETATPSWKYNRKIMAIPTHLAMMKPGMAWTNSMDFRGLKPDQASGMQHESASRFSIQSTERRGS